ncbi:hypothetical protein [Aurantiacibacter rhizosphaerae]|uniref:Uracil-DNA glycosylase-like domain-containing protein n=1 Tax=Aurantiacibacter rhizosphaerae TaxID=2691582 RepID=A0A844XBW4_9SPHN|nr:hypothetical protein [Aurantiacibacter rhizosphaerae]MWV27476.1 hypothetical protein [Aurantiacibacter rhizosphaerae]
MSDVLDNAEIYLSDIGLINRPGAVLYSSDETLTKGPVYLLGLNPGGSESSTLQDSIDASRRGNNAFLDEEWAPGGHILPKGQSTMQRRIKALCGEMGVATRSTPASNLAFTRSTGVATHPGYRGAVKLCEPVHKMFIEAIEPLFLMTFGHIEHFASGIEIISQESRSADHGKWQAHRGEASAFGFYVRFGNVPHLSVWGSDTREDVVRWSIEGLRA